MSKYAKWIRTPHNVMSPEAAVIADNWPDKKYGLEEICQRLNATWPGAFMPAAPAAGDALDAQRWRFIRRKLCLTGNGDGTCAIHAINLPASVPGWPEPGPAVAEFCDAAIDAEISSQQGEGGAA